MLGQTCVESKRLTDAGQTWVLAPPAAPAQPPGAAPQVSSSHAVPAQPDSSTHTLTNGGHPPRLPAAGARPVPPPAQDAGCRLPGRGLELHRGGWHRPGHDPGGCCCRCFQRLVMPPPSLACCSCSWCLVSWCPLPNWHVGNKPLASSWSSLCCRRCPASTCSSAWAVWSAGSECWDTGNVAATLQQQQQPCQALSTHPLARAVPVKP